MSRFENLSVEITVAEDLRGIKEELSKLKVIESLSARITANESELSSLSKAMSDLQDVNTELQKEMKEVKDDLQSRPSKADFDALKNKLTFLCCFPFSLM